MLPLLPEKDPVVLPEKPEKKSWSFAMGALSLFWFFVANLIFAAAWCDSLKNRIKFQRSLRSPARTKIFLDKIRGKKWDKFDQSSMRTKFCHPQHDWEKQVSDLMLKFWFPLEFMEFYQDVLKNPLIFRAEYFLGACLDAEHFGRRKLAIKYLRKIRGVYQLLDAKGAGGEEMIAIWNQQLRAIDQILNYLNRPAVGSEIEPEFEYTLGLAYGLNQRWYDAALHLQHFIASAPDDEQLLAARFKFAFARINMAPKASETSPERLQLMAYLEDIRQIARAMIPRATGERRRSIIILMANSYYILNSYQELLDFAREFLPECSEGSEIWAVLTYLLGIAFEYQDPADHQEAARAFDAILASDVSAEWNGYHVPTLAAYWRGIIAEGQGDRPQVRTIIDILEAMPISEYKEDALTRFRTWLS